MKKIIILLSCIAFILSTFLFYSFLHNRLSKENVYKAKEYEFYEAINLLKEKKYSEAYQKVNDIKSVEDQKIIKNIIAYSYYKEICDCFNEISKDAKKSTDLINEVATNNAIYGTIVVDKDKQKEIDDADAEIINKYGDLNIQYPKEILYSDLEDLYNSYGEFITSYNGINANLEEKLLDESKKNKLMADMENLMDKMNELSKYMGDVGELHPENEIPEQYRIMFGFVSNSNK